MARYSGYGISRKTFDDIEDLMRSLDSASKQFKDVQDVAAHLLASTQRGFAERKYRGPTTRPVDAKRGLGAPPWTIPVRRITGQTLAAWKTKKVAPGVWQTYNDSRGAYFVEYGIARGGGGRRRPILKMSMIETLRFVSRTRLAERIMGDTLGSLRSNKGQFRSFASRMQGSAVLGITGPSGRLPQ